MKCPKCELFNPDSAMKCNCGYDFQTGTMGKTYLTKKVEEKNNKDEIKKDRKLCLLFFLLWCTSSGIARLIGENSDDLLYLLGFAVAVVGFICFIISSIFVYRLYKWYSSPKAPPLIMSIVYFFGVIFPLVPTLIGAGIIWKSRKLLIDKNIVEESKKEWCEKRILKVIMAVVIALSLWWAGGSIFMKICGVGNSENDFLRTEKEQKEFEKAIDNIDYQYMKEFTTEIKEKVGKHSESIELNHHCWPELSQTKYYKTLSEAEREEFKEKYRKYKENKWWHEISIKEREGSTVK